MRIRIDGTHTELAYAITEIRAILPIRQITPLIPLQHRPHTWRVFLNTAPKRERRWIA
ncbi:hypothetical protein [Streptosporangium sp. KLBMP 9127]|nr:hypothetical protein [Streptosporangium sp. KLBMP 9127]